jgi:CIC family chloride channel protein
MSEEPAALESSETDPVPPGRMPRPRFFVAVVIVAVAAALFAIGFRAAVVAVVTKVLRAEHVVAAFLERPWWQRILLPAVGAAVAGLASARARQAGGGVGDVLEAVALGRRRIALRPTLWKALGSFLAIVTGSSIGREGAIIQVGGAVGSTTGAAFGIRDARRRALVAAGTAAGFAAAYNTPFAAVLFVIEVVTGVVALGAILPSFLAAAIATAITRFVDGPGPIYGAQAFAIRSHGELALHLVLGLLAGLVAVGFMRILGAAERGFARVQGRVPRAALGGAIVGLVACFAPQVVGNGYEPIAQILVSTVAPGALLLFLLAKPIATASSVGSGSPGGVFTPSLAIGAALGALVASTCARFVPLGPAGGYALVGMAAVVAATTHAPLMAAVLVFELSGDYEIVLPLLVATSAATAVARYLRPTSLYMDEVRRRGLRWEVTLGGRRILREPKTIDR